MTTARPSCCVMVLNYNGQELLAECLPSLLEAAAALGEPCPVAVLDNRSTTDDLAYLEREFPQVERILAESNDYLFSFNDALARRTEDVVIILNNDMTFDRGFIAPLLRYFADPAVFGVTARVFDWDRETVISARSRLVRRRLWYSLKRTFDDPEPCYTFYAAGGAAAYRRDMFLQLGGFDTLFRPAYYEEVDLSYRAWRRGWTAVYEPASIMYHRRAATLSQQASKDRWARIICRNQVLFNIKDGGGPGFLFAFLALLPVRWLRALVTGDRVTAGGIRDALSRLGRALARRRHRAGAGGWSEERFMRFIEEGDPQAGLPTLAEAPKPAEVSAAEPRRAEA